MIKDYISNSIYLLMLINRLIDGEEILFKDLGRLIKEISFDLYKDKVNTKVYLTCFKELRKKELKIAYRKEVCNKYL